MRHAIYRQQEGGLGELRAVIAVFTIADRTDGQHDTDIGIRLTKKGDGLLEVVGTLIDGEFLLLKQSSRAFLAIIDYFARLLQAVDVVGSEGKENCGGGTCRRSGRHSSRGGGEALERMEDGGWVVHRAKGVDDNGETLVLETLADAVSKTRTNEKQRFAGCNTKAWTGDVDDGSEFHIFVISIFRDFNN